MSTLYFTTKIVMVFYSELRLVAQPVVHNLYPAGIHVHLVKANRAKSSWLPVRKPLQHQVWEEPIPCVQQTPENVNMAVSAFEPRARQGSWSSSSGGLLEQAWKNIPSPEKATAGIPFSSTRARETTELSWLNALQFLTDLLFKIGNIMHTTTLYSQLPTILLSSEDSW